MPLLLRVNMCVGFGNGWDEVWLHRKPVLASEITLANQEIFKWVWPSEMETHIFRPCQVVLVIILEDYARHP